MKSKVEKVDAFEEFGDILRLIGAKLLAFYVVCFGENCSVLIGSSVKDCS